jgi:hypothetical protein
MIDRTVTLIVYVFAAMLALAMGLSAPLWAQGLAAIHAHDNEPIPSNLLTPRAAVYVRGRDTFIVDDLFLNPGIRDDGSADRGLRLSRNCAMEVE